MRDIVIIIVICLLVFVGGYFCESFLENSGEEIVELLKEIEDDIKNGNMEKLEKVEKVDEMWEDLKGKWNMIANHQNIDEIEVDIKKLIVSYENEEKEESLSHIAEIKTKIEDMPKGEKLELVNVL